MLNYQIPHKDTMKNLYAHLDSEECLLHRCETCPDSEILCSMTPPKIQNLILNTVCVFFDADLTRMHRWIPWIADWKAQTAQQTFHGIKKKKGRQWIP